jgi:hypothetical protein
MSGYVPNDWKIRKAPEPEPYNGNFDQQAPRPLVSPPQSKPDCLVGMRFIWDNGEALPPNIPYQLSTDQGSCIQGGLDARGSFTQPLPQSSYEAQLLANTDVDAAVASARSEMQAALDEILAAERAEAAQLSQQQAGRSTLSNHFHTAYAFGKGFFLGAFGMIKSAKEMHDLSSPHNLAWNHLASAWKAKAGPGETWIASYLRNFAQAQHEDLVQALGFDPARITREQFAEAYEIACFIYEDGPSKDMLSRFAVDYAKAQNAEEIAEFSGSGVFELVLMALLAVVSGGVAAAARGATLLRHAASLKRLGNAVKQLSQALKNARIKLKGRGQGKGTGAQTVEVPRPESINAEKLKVQSERNDGAGPLPTPIHSRYPDGTPVMEGQQPGKVKGPLSDDPHSVVQWDEANGRVYKAREYGENGVPIKDIDFTHPTFPNGRPRPDHTAPEQHIYIPNDPNNPKAGYKRGKGQPLELP